ncbi:MAG TPA: hypothetical protein VEG84_07530 [Thermoanaerobaculia bacterium]|nr:hypothetical protein [Thermoanaerobaculia bacterium]
MRNPWAVRVTREAVEPLPETSALLEVSARRLESLRRHASWRPAPVELPSQISPAAVVPPTDGAAFPETPSEARPSTDDEILRSAATLGIPWQRLLLEEIAAEQRLRRYLRELDEDCPLLAAAEVLSFSLLRSWRIRDQIESLACEARTSTVRGALRKLRIVFRRLTGLGDRKRVLLSEHLWFAYQRVLLLQQARRAAARSRGTMAERLALICSTAKCSYDDAAWAACLENSPRPGHRLEEAVRKVRDEGFLIPRAETEARALAELRRMIPRRPRRRRLVRPLSTPRRVPLPLDAF